MTLWLLSADMRAQFEQAILAGVMSDISAQAEYMAANTFDAADPSRVLSVSGDTARITISGVMTKSPNFMAMLFGGGNVTYPEIIAAFSSAEQNPAVKRIEMVVDSPGGQLDGLFEAVAALEARKKPLKALVRNQAASAAYALVAQADEIVAVNRAARVGSVGIVVSLDADPRAVSVTSTAAPKKRPDPTTEEGVAVIREELDALHQLFAESIAAGRETTVEKVNATFGQGGVLLADEALKRGMIDSVMGQPLRAVKATTKPTTAAIGGNNPETGPMNLAELKAQHPDVYAAAKQEGASEERERVSAHLIMGEASGALDTAIAAVKDGTEMTASLTATYMAAGMASRDQKNRQSDSDSAALAAAAASAASGADGDAMAVVALVESRLGM